MEAYLTILKVAGSIISILIGAHKLFLQNRSNRDYPTEDKVSLLKTYLNEEKKSQNQMYIEYLFTYIFGHKKLNATEINYLSKSDNPTQTIDRYIDSRSYVTIENQDSQIILKKPFTKTTTLNILRVAHLFLYAIFAVIALLLLFYVTPTYINANNWSYTFMSSLLFFLFGCFAILSILEARRISDALSLLSKPI
ncbi:MAG: hypothetical protein JAZ17_11020 [Candidatus Thiodiazotropha endolucinida]|nr:hypothetical protein [Candidatus Thiodiazotropha endolucinida]